MVDDPIGKLEKNLVWTKEIDNRQWLMIGVRQNLDKDFMHPKVNHQSVMVYDRGSTYLVRCSICPREVFI